MTKKKMSKGMKLVGNSLAMTMGVGVGTGVAYSMMGSLPNSNTNNNIYKGIEMTSMIPLAYTGMGIVDMMGDFGKTKHRRKK